MKNRKRIIPILLSTLFFAGCVSQQAHERAMEELEMASQNSAQEVERLQQVLETQQAQVVQLQEEKQDIDQIVEKQEKTLNQLQQETQDLKQALANQEEVTIQLQEEKENLKQALSVKDEVVIELEKEKQSLGTTMEASEKTIAQLEETKEALAQAVQTQEYEKEEQLRAVQTELEALYAKVAGLRDLTGMNYSEENGIKDTDWKDLKDVAQAFQHIRDTLEAQMNHFSELQQKNGELERNLLQLEARLQEVDRLRKELELVQRQRKEEEVRYAKVQEKLEQAQLARQEQEARLARVKSEVLTVGEEIDRITKALEEKFGHGLVVTQREDRLILTMLGQVLFDSGQADLTPLGLDIMEQVGKVLASLPNKNIQVEGHTDTNPIYGRLQQKFPTNWELSTARATTVLRFLIEQTGMSPKQFSATGYADTRPVAGNDTEEGRAQNRRVEIVLFPEGVVKQNQTVATLAP